MSNTTFDRFDRDTLAALKTRNLPRCRATSILRPGSDGDAELAKRLMEEADKYLAQFVEPVAMESKKCLCCGSPLTGIFGRFQWGITNGEGACSSCGYPARAIHRMKEIGTFSNFILQYHPDELSFDDEGNIR